MFRENEPDKMQQANQALANEGIHVNRGTAGLDISRHLRNIART